MVLKIVESLRPVRRCIFLLGTGVLLACTPMDDADVRPPLLVEASPAPGAEVPSGPTTLRFTFDQPMQDKSWSLVRDGAHPFPDVVALQYLTDRTLAAEVVLQPGTTYQFWLNHSQFKGFRSADNIPLDPYRYRITATGSPDA